MTSTLRWWSHGPRQVVSVRAGHLSGGGGVGSQALQPGMWHANNAGHLSLISKPGVVTDVIEQAAQATG